MKYGRIVSQVTVRYYLHTQIGGPFFTVLIKRLTSFNVLRKVDIAYNVTQILLWLSGKQRFNSFLENGLNAYPSIVYNHGYIPGSNTIKQHYT